MNLFWRYQLALMGGFLAMSAHVFLTASRNLWFTPQHLGSAISAGLMFGHVMALMIIVSRDLPRFLRDKMPRWITLIVSIVGGIAFGTLAWWVHVTFTLYQTNPDLIILLIGGFCLAIGFVLSSILQGISRYAPTKSRILLFALMMSITAIVIFLPIYITFQNFLATINTPQPSQALLYFQPDNPQLVWIVGVPFALAIAFFGQLPMLFVSNSLHPVEQ